MPATRASRILVVLAVGALLSCGSPAAPPPAEPSADPELSNVPEPDDPELTPEPAPEPEIEKVTGIPACDEYLALYRRCEPQLESQIMAGDRRSYSAERGSLEYFMTTEEAPGLPAACADMLAGLRTECTAP